MNELRIFLLISGVCLITGIYLWGSLQHRKKQRQQTVQKPLQRHDILDVKIETRPAAEIDYSSVLDGLKQSIAESKEFEPSVLEEGLSIGKQGDSAFTGSTELSETQQDLELQQQEAERQVPERIIMMHIVPRARNRLSGSDILKASLELDMTHGEMDIFHHYGVGKMKMQQPVFSMADMREPGNFDINNMDSFSTSGLVMFMCIPCVIDGQVIFELMRNTAQRLAKMLSADVCDEHCMLLTNEKLEEIRRSLS